MTSDDLESATGHDALDRAEKLKSSFGLPEAGLKYEYKTHNSVFDKKWHSIKTWEDIRELRRKLEDEDNGLYAIRNVEPLVELSWIRVADREEWLEDTIEAAEEKFNAEQ